MNHKLFYRTSSRSFLFIFVIFSIILCLHKPAISLENNKEPKTCFGFGGLFGFDNARNVAGPETKWKPGHGFGGGIIFESMLSGTFGIHSGLWYSRYMLKLEFPDDSSGAITDHKITSDFITMPVYLITSLSSRTIGFNLLTGLAFGYISRSRMEPGPNGQSSENIQKYLGAGQIGAGAGFEILFKTTRFTRFFINCTGEYYFKNLLSDDGGSIDHLYNASVRSGFMLSTF
jgi:hypothetical protein